MSDSNQLFIKAAQEKYRFATSRGEVTTEDLFDLPLTVLDKLAVDLDTKVNAAGGKSFLADKRRSPGTTLAAAQLEVVKEVINIKQTTADAAKAKAIKAAQRATLEKLLERKATEALEGLTVEDIKAQIAALGD